MKLSARLGLRFGFWLACVALSGCTADPQKAREAPPQPPPDSQQSGLVVVPADSPKLDQIRVDTVRRGEVPTDEVTAPGKVEVNPNRVSRVVLPVTGRIFSVAVKLGDQVEAGQTLLTIDSPDADAAVSAVLQAEAALTQARAALVKAQADYDRSSDLYQHDAVAKKEVLSADNALTQAKAAVEQADAGKQQMIRRLQILGLKAGSFGQKVVVLAPISGKVLDMSVVPGEYRNDTNTPLVTIADLSTIWVSSDVPESYIRFIQVGEPVDISLLAYPGEKFTGRVARIADTVDAQSRTVKVHAELANPLGRLRPEMFAQVRHVESMQRVPVIPSSAVIQGDGHSSVFVETARGHFKQVTVTIGRKFGDQVPVLGGLREGDRIVVDGGMLLESP